VKEKVKIEDIKEEEGVNVKEETVDDFDVGDEEYNSSIFWENEDNSNEESKIKGGTAHPHVATYEDIENLR